jgi:hypothetical protein
VVASRAEQSKAAALGFEAKRSDGSEVMVGGSLVVRALGEAAD